MTKKEREQVEKYYREQAKKIAKEHWGVELTCPITFVNRVWKRRSACFIVNNEAKECEIRLNHKIHDKIGYEGYLPILKHELFHWYLWSIEEPVSDVDPEFVRECIRIGAAISRTKKAQRALEEYKEQARRRRVIDLYFIGI